MNLKSMHGNLQQILFLFICFVCSASLQAQLRSVSGTIKDSKGSALPGVGILVKGTSTGVNTDSKGSYSIKVKSNDILVFTFIGYVPQEIAVGDQGTIDVVLIENVNQLGDVVVTALGVKRETKALPSSVTEIQGVSFTSARENNFGAAIQGRVAGVNVSTPNTGPAGSSRVIIRGNKSLNGDNQPLYVVDGIPMDNTNWGQAGEWGGADQGDGLTSINPDDIESVTVLKGAGAAALYGSRGGFGVINITTKKGTASKGIGIEFSSNYVFEKVINYLDLQTQYGQGGLALSDPNNPHSPMIGSKPSSQQDAFQLGANSAYEKIAWGARLDGNWNIMWDGNKRSYALVGVPHNYDAFFQTGNSFTNNLALRGGNDKQTFRFSFSDLKNDGVIPNSGFNRKNASFSTDGKFGKKVTFNAKILYSNEEAKNRPMISDSPGNAAQAVMLLPPNYDVNDMRGKLDKPGAVAEGMTIIDNKNVGEELQLSDNLWNQNPWWAAYQFINSSIRDRVIASATLRYDITNFLYLQGRIGMDWSVRKIKSLTPQGTGYERLGAANEGEDQVREINQEWTLGFDKAFGKVNVIAFAGGNKMVNKDEHIGANGFNFNIPFFTSVNNTNFQNFEYTYHASGINSLFGSAEISYGGYLYLTGTTRKDWFSVLNPSNNSKLYPSAGLSFVFTDAFKNLPKVFSYGKLRASWGQVATAAVGPYFTNLTYVLDAVGHRSIALGHYAGGPNGGPTFIPNPTLRPALSTEFELGTELKILKGRAGVDLAYYDQKTTDDILDAAFSTTSGFYHAFFNIGKLSNKGIEILLTAIPVQGAFSWEVSLNLAKNNNKVIALSPGMNELGLEEPRTQTVLIKQIVGYPFGMITGFIQKKINGIPIFDSAGLPVRSDNYEILGNSVADLTGGLNNSFTYKQFTLSFLIDFKSGGDIYSGTNVRLTESGLQKQTLAGREIPLTLTGRTELGRNEDGAMIYLPFSKTYTEEEAHNYWSALGETDQSRFTYNASFIKLRQVTFDYELPSKILKKTPVKTLNVSFVGRNLLCLYKKTPNIDPEASYSSSSSQGLDYFGLPSTRTYGINLKATF